MTLLQVGHYEKHLQLFEELLQELRVQLSKHSTFIDQQKTFNDAVKERVSESRDFSTER